MASTSKQKRSAKKPQHAAKFEIARSNPSAQQLTTAHTVTFNRLASGRLGEQTELAEVEVLAEDLAILAQDPEYLSFPSDDNLNFGYFEQTVQSDDKDN
jgi:hypothetical protein